MRIHQEIKKNKRSRERCEEILLLEPSSGQWNNLNKEEVKPMTKTLNYDRNERQGQTPCL